ncbi:MAG: metalloregulator ArsR/SmtB family transcription factor, partial [Nocardioides sp.]
LVLSRDPTALLCDHIRMRVDREDEQVLLAAEIFRLLADPTRVHLLHALSGGELSVNGLAESVGRRNGQVSQHLAKLRLARLVTTRRQGNQVLYRVVNEHVSQLVEDVLDHVEHLGPGIPTHHQDD